MLSCFHRLSRLESQPLSEESMPSWTIAHRQFHEALSAGCGSTWTMRLCRLLYDKSERYRNLSAIDRKGRARAVATEHKELADAAMARDADALCWAIERHLDFTAKLILERVAEPRATKHRMSAG